MKLNEEKSCDILRGTSMLLIILAAVNYVDIIYSWCFVKFDTLSAEELQYAPIAIAFLAIVSVGNAILVTGEMFLGVFGLKQAKKPTKNTVNIGIAVALMVLTAINAVSMFNISGIIESTDPVGDAMLLAKEFVKTVALIFYLTAANQLAKHRRNAARLEAQTVPEGKK